MLTKKPAPGTEQQIAYSYGAFEDGDSLYSTLEELREAFGLGNGDVVTVWHKAGEKRVKVQGIGLEDE